MPKATFNDFINSSSVFKEFFDQSHFAKLFFDRLSEDERIEMAVEVSEKGFPAMSTNLWIIEGCVERALGELEFLWRYKSSIAYAGQSLLKKLFIFGKKILPLHRKTCTIDGHDYDCDYVDFIRNAFIKMQGFILEPFGYFPNGMEKPVDGKFFKTAPCYEYVEGKASMPVPRVREEKLRKAFLEEGDIGAMFELFQIYKRTGEEDKSHELMGIYMDRGYYRWIEEANEARMAYEENHQNDESEN